MNNKLVFTERTSLRINIIRIIAAWCVMIGHGFVFFQISIFRSQQYFCYLQNIGVVLLLLLAGFLLLYSFCKFFGVLSSELLKSVLFNGFSYPFGKLIVKIQIVHNGKPHSENFLCLKKMSYICA